MPNHPEFKFHKLTPAGQEKAQMVAEAFDNLLDRLVQIGCDSGPRYLALVKTKLEEACFFAKKSIATNQHNQEK